MREPDDAQLSIRRAKIDEAALYAQRYIGDIVLSSWQQPARR